MLGLVLSMSTANVYVAGSTAVTAAADSSSDSSTDDSSGDDKNAPQGEKPDGEPPAKPDGDNSEPPTGEKPDGEPPQGDVVWDSISQLDFYMTDGSTLAGAVTDDESNAGEGGDGYCNCRSLFR